MRDRPRPRITPTQIAEIRRLRGLGLPLKAIAAEIGVSLNSACRHGKPPVPRRTAMYLDVPRVQSAAFIPPPSLARLMAGR